MLHIVIGDAFAETLSMIRMQGIIIPWREILMEGPVRAYTDIENFWNERSIYLHEAFGGSIEEYLQYQADITKRIFSNDPEEEIILWFDTDLFCQLNLAFLIYLLIQSEMENKKISLICPQDDPGMEDFHSMGELEPDQLSGLLKTGKELSMEDKQFYSEIWKYYCESDPQNLYYQLEVMRERNPVLYQAILLHFHSFPSIKNGINRIEKEIMESIERGNDNFALIFLDYVRNYLFEGYGIGDWQLLIYLQEMGKGDSPLLT